MTKQTSLLDPADDLTQVLGSELAAHFMAHRKALRKPMTAFAAQLMAKKLRSFPDPVAAVEQAILKGWTDVYPVEAKLLNTRVGAAQRPTMAALFGEMEEFFDGSERQAGSDQAAQGTFLSLPEHGRKH